MDEPSRLVLLVRHLERIRDQGEINYPEECCGFLLGKTDGDRIEVANVQPVTNEQDENRARRFLISPEQFSAAERFAAERKLEVVGFYHTHPDHPAIPSEFDREHALPFYAYAILSVREGRAAELRCWRLKEDRSGYDEDQIVYKL